MSSAPVLAVLEERLASKICRGAAAECWPWRAGVSRSGRREVDYGIVRHPNNHHRRWRAHRLVLLLKTAPAELPREADESEEEWLFRVDRFFSAFEASHSCDVSLCCNPAHLEWLTHADNVHLQSLRERGAEDAA